MSNVISLADLRKKQAQKGRRAMLPLEQRVEELEGDLDRVIELAIDMENRLYQQERRVWKLVRLLKEHAAQIEASIPVAGRPAASASVDPDSEGQ